MTTDVDVSQELGEPLYDEDLEWVKDNAAKFIPAIQKALAKGSTPEKIYNFYMGIAEHRRPFWIRVKHAAIAIQRGATA